MIVCVDVDYREQATVAGCVGFAEWASPAPAFELVHRIPGPAAAYRPGVLYQRELPCILAALGELPQPADMVVVDGYVWLHDGRKGLGAHLYHALAGAVPVVGVAKNRFRGAPAVEVRRGSSARPLYVTAAGVDPARASDGVRRMSGEHRIPDLLKLADRLARGG